MYKVIGPMTVCGSYRWSICICMPDFIRWHGCSSGTLSRIQCLPNQCMLCICNRVSPMQGLHVMRVVQWAAGKASSFMLLNSLQLIFCCSCSTSGSLNLVRLFLLQVCFLQFCFSDLLVYLNCSVFSLSSIFFHSSPVFCFGSDFSFDSFRHFWVWPH